MLTIEFIHKKVEDYMNRVKSEKPKDFIKLTTLIHKLAEKGKELLKLPTFKKIKINEQSLRTLDIIVIPIKIQRKQYRIHTALTPHCLYLLHAFDKKSSKTSKKDLETTIDRVKTLA